MRNEEKLKLHILLTQFPCAFEEKQQIKQQPEEPVEQRNEQKKNSPDKFVAMVRHEREKIRNKNFRKIV